MENCDAPGCTNDPTYIEPAEEHVKQDPELKDELEVCHKHVNPVKDGIEKL